MHHKTPRLRRSLLGALLFSLLTSTAPGLGGCTSQPAPAPAEESSDTASASFSIAVDNAPVSGGKIDGERSLSAFAEFSFADVNRIRIDVVETATDIPLFRGVDLTLSGGVWSGTVPFLPRNTGLTFQARATGLEDVLLFSGSTDQTLAGDNESVTIFLAPVTDGESITLPRIKKIVIPSQFPYGKRGNIDFVVEAPTGEQLTYLITPAAGGGSFYPVQGTLALLNTTGTFVSQYVPPSVTAPTDFLHSVTVTNEDGHSVTTTFSTHVLPVDPSQDAVDTHVNVLFNPVIQALHARRPHGSSVVIWEATVVDDEEGLSYQWSFLPNGSFEPAPYISSQTNPTTLENYTPAVQGDLILEVTDADGGKTTLTYPLAPSQFPDNPYDVGDLNGLISIRAGGSHTCALFDNANVRCWGANKSGQLGYEHTLNIGDDEHPWTAGSVNIVGNASQVVTGTHHTCALLDSGFVRCWGLNRFGQLGYGHTANIGDGEPVTSEGYVSLGGRAVKLAAGDQHTCAVLNTGKVRCWGYNGYGQLGYGHTDSIGDNEWVWSVGDVDLGSLAQDITAGGNHTCALLTNGKVRCWGYNGYGQLGYANTLNIGDNEAPSTVGDVDVGGLAIQLSAGANHTCALLSTSRIVCWGNNNYGQLGYHYTWPWYAGDNETPAQLGTVNVGSTVLQVATGTEHTCALLSNGSVKCWGRGDTGQLGYGNANYLTEPPASTVHLSGASAYYLTAGGAHTCALLSTGQARCWGAGDSGRLGYANTITYGDNELPSAAGDIQVLTPPAQ